MFVLNVHVCHILIFHYNWIILIKTYYYSKVCWQIYLSFSDCADVYGNTFQTINDFYVDQYNDVSLIMTSNDVINECKAACIKENGFVCLMAEINLITNECTLSSTDYSQIPTSVHVISTDYVTLLRDCA